MRTGQKCLELSSESGKRRCSWDGRRQTVARPWSGDRASPVSERRSTNGRDDESRRAEVTTPVDVSRPTDAVREVRRRIIYSQLLLAMHRDLSDRLSVCLSVSVTGVSRAETAEPIQMPFEAWTREGARNHVLDWNPDPRGKRLLGETLWERVFLLCLLIHAEAYPRSIYSTLFASSITWRCDRSPLSREFVLDQFVRVFWQKLKQVTSDQQGMTVSYQPASVRLVIIFVSVVLSL